MLVAGVAYSQDMRQALNQTLKVDVDLVLINATVTDPQNRYVTGLEGEHFEIFEDRVEQELQYFSAEDVALSLGIVFDVSGSMKDKLSIARDAAVTFLKTGSPEDEYFLAEFSAKPSIAQDFTTDISRLQNQLIFTPAKGMTALYDAVYLALEKVDEGSNPKKALLMITDGEDNRSRYTFGNVREFVKESDVQIYSIGIVNNWNSQLAMGRTGRALIEELSEVTGGRSFFPNSVYELEDITTKIAVELKNQYVIGYFSTNEGKDGKWRKVQVKVNPPRGLPRLTVRAKQGYYGPVQ
jgi:Ca-activated chloride channel family protein